MAARLVRGMAKNGLTLALAESCTAGLVAELIGRVSGASRVLWGSFVCYSPDAKQRMLGIESLFLEQHGLVSRETAREMAVHALEKAGVSAAAAVTGIAGPSGDGSGLPVGTVWTATAWRENSLPVQRVALRETEHHFTGERKSVQMQAAAAVLEELLEFVPNNSAGIISHRGTEIAEYTEENKRLLFKIHAFS
jgi:PncC family amidohydrolase